MLCYVLFHSILLHYMIWLYYIVICVHELLVKQSWVPDPAAAQRPGQWDGPRRSGCCQPPNSCHCRHTCVRTLAWAPHQCSSCTWSRLSGERMARAGRSSTQICHRSCRHQQCRQCGSSCRRWMARRHCSPCLQACRMRWRPLPRGGRSWWRWMPVAIANAVKSCG